MRILFYSSYFYPYTSGITTYPYKVFSHLAKKFSISILTFCHDKKLAKIELHNRLKIIRMPYLFKLYKGFISPQSFFIFLKEIKKNDLIIINLPSIEGLPLLLLARLLGKKVISIFHCYLDLNNNFFLNIINSITNKIVNFQLALSNKIISYTDDYINSLKISKKIKKKIFTILPPILKLPISKTKYKKFLKLKKRNIWIGYAGRISSEKGLEYLINAISSKHYSNKNFSTEIVFAGPYGKNVSGENSYYLKIKNLLKSKKIKYRFFGNLKNGHLGAFYKTIDLLVLPSINKTEAFGMVQAEAMLLGKPVIASNLPGVKIPIKLTKMGLLVKPKNSLQLIKAIIKILKNKNKYSNKKLIKNAGKIFDIKKVYKFYEEIIKDLKNEKN
mgnify:CR=1 FL=1